MPKKLPSNQPDLWFEDNAIGRMKKQIWEASDAEIDEILAEYGVPSPCEWAKPGSYIQTTIRSDVVKRRQKNDIVLIPIGCSELHGEHTVSSMDTLFVSHICEAVRRYTEKKGNPVSLALPALMYGSHPYHHLGMPGTIIVREEVAMEMVIDVMLGLWNDGFRKMILVNNHGHLWMLEGAIQQFTKRYQLPGIYRVIDWHRAVREFWRLKDEGGWMDTPFIHADEAETSLGLLLFPEMVRMENAVNTQSVQFLETGHYDSSVDQFVRPQRWSEGEGHAAIEMAGTPEGVVGKPTLGDAQKGKRPIAAICKYLTMLCEDMITKFPAGTTPPVEAITLRKAEELEPYLREPMSPGWRSAYVIPRVGQNE